ncbi:17760_t:CDS:2, partial [Racocetra fulgida]
IEGDVEPIGVIKNIDSRDFTELRIVDNNDVIDMDSNIEDIGGPVFNHYNRAYVSINGIINGAIGDITLSTGVDTIIDEAELRLVNFRREII